MTKLCVAISLFVTAGFLFFLVPTWYEASRDIDALIDRAQVSANAEDMLAYTVELKGNMERLGMTSGHAAAFFTTPANDMSLHYQTVQRIISRLQQVKNLPQDGTAYQVALADLRGTLRELSNPTEDWMMAHYGWWMLTIFVICWCVTYGVGLARGSWGQLTVNSR